MSEDDEPSFFTNSSNYLKSHWKIFLAGAIVAVLLLIAFLLVLFLVILKSGGSTVPQTTVVPTTVTPVTGKVLNVSNTSTLSSLKPTVPITTASSTTVPTTAKLSTVPTTVTKTTVPLTTKQTAVPSTTVTKSTVLSTVPTTPLSTIVTSPNPPTLGTKPPIPPPTQDPSTTCVSGFTLVNNKCWMLSPYTVSCNIADNLCFNSGGSTLPTIKNTYENDELAVFVFNKGVDRIWLGLKCNSNDSSSCVWDYGQGDTKSYSNFLNGSPNITAGNCVYYNVSNKLWISDSCDGIYTVYSMLCQLPTTKLDNCKNNFNGNCYIQNGQGLLFDDADDQCKRECGTLLSIHSAIENRFVSSIYQYYSESIGGTLLLGSVAASKDMIFNRDYSIATYNNIQNFTMDKNCVFFDVKSGNWSSGDCSSRGWSLCKRPVGVSC